MSNPVTKFPYGHRTKKVDHDEVYQKVLQMRGNQKRYKEAHSKLREKLEPLTYAEVAKEFKISPEMVRVIINKFESGKTSAKR